MYKPELTPAVALVGGSSTSTFLFLSTGGGELAKGAMGSDAEFSVRSSLFLFFGAGDVPVR